MRLLATFTVALLAASAGGRGQDGGPYFHEVRSASSPDGLTWTHDGRVLLEHASVPSAALAPDGALRIYYVDSSTPPEFTNCAESRDGGLTLRVLGCTIEGRGGEKALDPAIVTLPDGRYRLYYYAARPAADVSQPHSVNAAVSRDGVHFVDEGAVFTFPGLVDPDVFWNGREWLMFVFSAEGGGTVVAHSADGLHFSYLEMLSPANWGTTAPVDLGDGRFRLYAFDQPFARVVQSFLSTDGLTWTPEPGVRLEAPAGYQVTDPFVVRLPDGSWKMVYKVSKRPQQPGPS